MDDEDDCKAAVPIDRFGDNRWIDLHELFVLNARDKEADVLFIGDDHIALLDQTQVFEELFAPLHCLCFGSMADRTAHLIWRLEHGELDNINPKVIVVSIGAFNYGSTSDRLLAAMGTIAALIRNKQPNSVIFFLVGAHNFRLKLSKAIFQKLLPSGRTPNAWRETISAVNDRLDDVVSTAAASATTIDFDPSLIGTDGLIDHHDMFDYVHLSQQGYRKVFELVHVAVSGVLGPDQ